jgi:hypothetical protein
MLFLYGMQKDKTESCLNYYFNLLDKLKWCVYVW